MVLDVSALKFPGAEEFTTWPEEGNVGRASKGQTNTHVYSFSFQGYIANVGKDIRSHLETVETVLPSSSLYRDSVCHLPVE